MENISHTTMRKKDKITMQIWLAILIAITGVVLLFLSFFVHPLGVVDPSVLTALGELLTFSGSVLGIDGNYRLKSYRLREEIRQRNGIDESEEGDA